MNGPDDWQLLSAMLAGFTQTDDPELRGYYCATSRTVHNRIRARLAELESLVRAQEAELLRGRRLTRPAREVKP